MTGTPPLHYQLLHSSDTVIQGTIDDLTRPLFLDNLTEATYSLHIQNVRDIQEVQTLMISRFPNVDLYFETSDYNGYAVSCAEATDGNLSVFSSDTTVNNFKWNTGATTPSLSNLASGFYQLSVTDKYQCVHSDSIELIAPLPLQMNLSTQSPLCFGDTFGQLTIEKVTHAIGEVSYSLDGILYEMLSPVPLVKSLPPATYMFFLQDENNCQLTTSFTIPEAKENLLELGADQIVVLGDKIIVEPLSNFDILHYVWQKNKEPINCTDCPSLSLQPIESAHYELMAIDANDCVITDEVRVLVYKEKQVFLPTAFSPNGDGQNDVYRVYLGPSIQSVNIFKIVDARGRVLFEQKNFLPTDATIRWEGRFNGQFLLPATFIAVIEVVLIDGTVEQEVGTFNLMR